MTMSMPWEKVPGLWVLPENVRIASQQGCIWCTWFAWISLESQPGCKSQKVTLCSIQEKIVKHGDTLTVELGGTNHKFMAFSIRVHVRVWIFEKKITTNHGDQNADVVMQKRELMWRLQLMWNSHPKVSVGCTRTGSRVSRHLRQDTVRCLCQGFWRVCLRVSFKYAE